MTNAASQQIRFCRSVGGVRLAFATTGDGPPLVKAGTWLTHVELELGSPVWAPWIAALSSHTTLLRYDARGCGLSDRDVDDRSLDAAVADLDAVIAAAGLGGRFALLGMSQGGPVAVAYAARHPERVSHLILYGAYARGLLERGLDQAHRDEARALLEVVRSGWGRDNPAFRQLFTSLFLPGGTPGQMAWFNDLQRASASPEGAAALIEASYHLDVTGEAAGLRVPTLVLHARGDARVPLEEGRLLAALIPGARFVGLDSANHVLLDSEPAWERFLAEVASFLELPPLRDASRPAPAASPMSPPGPASLTAREQDVVALLRRGWTNKRIARELDLSPKTVRNYVSTVLTKLGATNRTELASMLADPTLGDAVR